MMHRNLLCVVVFLTIGTLSLRQPDKEKSERVLVLVDNLSTKETHSLFFKNLVKDGFTLTFKVADDPNIQLKKYGVYLFEHLILFSPSVEEFGGSLNVESITQFIDDGGNILAAGSSNTAEALRDVAAECGLEADEDGTSVIDHLNFDIKVFKIKRNVVRLNLFLLFLIISLKTKLVYMKDVSPFSLSLYFAG